MSHLTRVARWMQLLVATPLLSFLLVGASPASACVGDCNNNGVVAINELITGVNIALGSQPVGNCLPFDSSGNGAVEINELITGVNNALNGCSAGNACTSSAEVRLAVVNRSGASRAVTLDGALAKYTCCPGTFTADYTQSLTLPAPAECSDMNCTGTCSVGTCSCDSTTVPRCTVSVTTRNPGEWKHGISVASTGQKQYQRSAVVAGTVNDTAWTVFATVKTVTAMYSLQNAITSANSSTAPVLIQVDHSSFSGSPATLTVASSSEVGITNEIVIDGTNSDGHPSPLADFTTRVYPTRLTLNPPDPKNQAYASTLKATAKVGLMGLDIRRILGEDSAIQSANQPIIWLAANSKNSFIRNSRIDGGAAARGSTCNGGIKTCIYGDSIGSTGFADAAMVEQSEVRHCFRRAASINDGHLVMRDNWLHHNRKGGPLADSNKGKVQLARNLIEDDGKNCPGAMRCTADGTSFGAACTVTSSCPASDGCSGTGEFCAVDPNYANDPVACNTSYTESSVDAVVVEDNTNEANAARLETDGDVVRNASGHGILLRENAEADINNTYICGMGSNGIDVNHDPTPAPTPKMFVNGSAMAFNARGVQIHRDQTVSNTPGRPANISFGDHAGDPPPTPSNPGNNAFTMNGGTEENFAYSDQGGGADRFAEGNQWEHCGTTNTCNVTMIQNKDVNSTAGNVYVSPSQAHRNPSNPLSILAVSPTKVTRRGAVVTITGTGFNAIDGYAPRAPTPGTGATDCESLADGNKCASQGGLRGVCVEFQDDNNAWIPADDVIAVTPTTIVVKSSIACSKGRSVRVTRQDNALGGYTEYIKNFCTN